MKLLDRIALSRAIKMLLDFLYDVIKLFSPRKDGDKPVTPKVRRWRKKTDE